MIKCRLQAWIDNDDLDYSKLARLAGVSIESVRSLAKNQFVRIDVGTWQAIAIAMKRPAMELFYWEEVNND